MQKIDFIVKKDLEPFVNCIMIEKKDAEDAYTHMPLYADGYPGIMFQQSTNGFYRLPKRKLLSELFLYGQTLAPVALESKGKHQFVVIQLYPFASKYLLGVDPKILNDECFDLLQLSHIDAGGYKRRLEESSSLAEKIDIISDLMLALIKHHQLPPNDQIQAAISLILKKQGNVKITEILSQVYMSERTFERRFFAQVGLKPKQFAKIIQFQSSLHRLNEANFDKLVEVGIESGFSDQSHFIRAFKNYTSQTPSYYLKQIKSSS